MASNPPVRAFVSYAHEDRGYHEELEKYLTLLQRNGVLSSWSDREIHAGANWREELDSAVEEAQLFLALVSVNFLASDYCYEVEMTRALARHTEGSLRIIPVICDFCPWADSPLARFQALPDDAKPITDAHWQNPAEAWNRVANGIRRVVTELASERRERVAERQLTSRDPSAYFELLRREHADIDLRGMGAQVAERLPLDHIYIRLRASGKGHSESRGKTLRSTAGLERSGATISLPDALRAGEQIAIIGDPGTGKTTFLRYLAQHLARAQLGESSSLAKTGLPAPAPLPIFVRTSALAAYLRQHDTERLPEDAPEHLTRYLDFSLAGSGLGLAADFLSVRVNQGGCLLMLDGLDEIPGIDMRERVSKIIDRALHTNQANRFIITCRTRAWQGRTVLAAALEVYRLAS